MFVIRERLYAHPVLLQPDRNDSCSESVHTTEQCLWGLRATLGSSQEKFSVGYL
jgi:hypothetical protein